MPVESAADRASFFNQDEFATAARYTPPGSSVATDCTVVYDRGAAKRRFDAGNMDAVTAERQAWISADEVATVAKGGTLEIGTRDDDGVFTLTETLRVAEKPKLDETGFMWTAELVIV